MRRSRGRWLSNKAAQPPNASTAPPSPPPIHSFPPTLVRNSIIPSTYNSISSHYFHPLQLHFHFHFTSLSTSQSLASTPPPSPFPSRLHYISLFFHADLFPFVKPSPPCTISFTSSPTSIPLCSTSSIFLHRLPYFFLLLLFSPLSYPVSLFFHLFSISFVTSFQQLPPLTFHLFLSPLPPPPQPLPRLLLLPPPPFPPPRCASSVNNISNPDVY